MFPPTQSIILPTPLITVDKFPLWPWNLMLVWMRRTASISISCVQIQKLATHSGLCCTPFHCLFSEKNKGVMKATNFNETLCSAQISNIQKQVNTTLLPLLPFSKSLGKSDYSRIRLELPVCLGALTCANVPKPLFCSIPILNCPTLACVGNKTWTFCKRWWIHVLTYIFLKKKKNLDFIKYPKKIIQLL